MRNNTKSITSITFVIRNQINLKTLDVDKLRSKYNALYSKKETLQNTYKSAEKEIKNLSRKLENINQYLDRTPGQEQTTNRKPEKDFTTL